MRLRFWRGGKKEFWDDTPRNSGGFSLSGRRCSSVIGIFERFQKILHMLEIKLNQIIEFLNNKEIGLLILK
jgi:hypothetical protein